LWPQCCKLVMQLNAGHGHSVKALAPPKNPMVGNLPGCCARPATTKGCRVVQWQCGGRSALSALIFGVGALIFGVGPLLAASAVAINRHNLDLLCDDRQAAGKAEKLQGRQTFLCGGLNRGTTLSGQISPSYASTNRRGKSTTYRAVCGKRATLLDNADRASRKPRCGLELNKRLEC
jgi:hypothetical protein